MRRRRRSLQACRKRSGHGRSPHVHGKQSGMGGRAGVATNGRPDALLRPKVRGLAWPKGKTQKMATKRCLKNRKP
jgi:hypothetical protein